MTTTMKKHQILYRHYGENSDTPKTPWKVYDPADGINLEEKVMCCLYWDDDRLVPTNLYAIHDVYLPGFLSPSEWLRNQTAWGWLWWMSLDAKVYEMSEGWQRGLLTIRNETQLYAVLKLLETKPHSPFRISLKEQLVKWLDTPASDRRFPDPFSRKQWEALIDQWTAREGKNRSEHLYQGHAYNQGAPLPDIDTETEEIIDGELR